MNYYFDNSSTSLKKPETVAKAVYDALASETLGNPSRGAHLPAINALRRLYEVRQSVADLFHLEENDRIGFTINGTTALNMAISSFVPDNSHVITTVLEHNSVLRPLYKAAERGVTMDTVSYLKKEGHLNYAEFETFLTPQTKTVVCTHGSNVLGDVIDLDFVAAFCQKHELHLIIDGAQTTGLIDLSLKALNPTAFCFTGHKSLYGPQGTGGIIVGNKMPFSPLLVGGSGSHSFQKEQPKKYPDIFEAGTANIHSLVGLKAGIDYVITQSPTLLHQKQVALLQQFYKGCCDIPEIIIYSSPTVTENIGILALNVGDWPSSTIAELLADKYHIAVRAGAHCAPLVHQTFKTETQGMVRFSFSSFNTSEEVDYALTSLAELVSTLKD